MRYRIAALAVLAAASTSCGVIGSEFTVKKTVGVHARDTDPTCQVDTLTYDLKEDKAFNDLRGVIGRVQLRKVHVEVVDPKTDPSSVATRAGGTLRVGATDTSTELVLGTWADVALAAGQGQDIAFDQAAADALTNLALHPPNVFTVESKGCADAVPAWFDFRVDLTLWAGM